MSKAAIYSTKIIFGGQVANSLKNAFKYSQSQTKATTQAYSSMHSSIAIGAVATGAAIAAGFTAAAVHASSFQTKMADVSTLLVGDYVAKTAALQASVEDVSILTGQSTTTMSEGLYEVISAFGDTADASGQLKVAAQTAVAGNAQVADSVKLLSAVTKGYGDTSVEANQKVADMAFETVRLGQTTYPELASEMGKTIAVANALGVKQEEIFGVTASLTGVTGNTSEVITQFKSSLSGLMKPSSDMQKALETLGYANGKAAIEAEGYGRLLIKLKKLVNDDEIAFANLFGRVEAKTAVLALTGAQAADLAMKTEAMTNASGAAERAFERKADTAAFAFNRIITMGSVMASSLGEYALPAVVEVGEGLYASFVENREDIEGFIAVIGTGMVMAFDGLCAVVSVTAGVVNQGAKALGYLSEHSDEAEAIIIGLTIAIGGYQIAQNALYLHTLIGVTAINLWTGAAGIATAVTSGLGATIAFLMSPIGMVIVGIAALAGVGWYLYRNWDTVTAALAGFWSDRIIPAAKGIGEFFKSMFEGITESFKTQVNFWIIITNAMISGLNSISIDIPEWVPKVGGNSFGVNIPLLPMFAKGGFTNQPSIFGEAGPEAAIPLKRNNPRSIALLNETARRIGVQPQQAQTTTTVMMPFLSGLKNRLTAAKLEPVKALKAIEEKRITKNTSSESNINVQLNFGNDLQNMADQPNLMKLIEDAVNRGVKKGIEQERSRERRIALGTS